MPAQAKGARGKRRSVTQGGLTRVTSYLYEDEIEAVEKAARRERCSQAELIRRAVRAYLKISPPAE
jgi:ribbon-helix-helix CopG family protein